MATLLPAAIVAGHPHKTMDPWRLVCWRSSIIVACGRRLTTLKRDIDDPIISDDDIYWQLVWYDPSVCGHPPDAICTETLRALQTLWQTSIAVPKGGHHDDQATIDPPRRLKGSPPPRSHERPAKSLGGATRQRMF